MSINPFRASLHSSIGSASLLNKTEGNNEVEKELEEEYENTEWNYRAISYAIAACLLGDTSYSMLVTFFPKAAAKRGLSPSAIGVIFASFQIANVIGTLVVPTITSYFGGIKTLQFAIVAQAVLMVCMCFTDLLHTAGPFFGVCIFLRSLSGFIASLAEVSGMGLTMRSAPRDKVGEAFGILESARLMGMVFGPTLAAGLVSAFGYVGPFAFAAACFGVTFIIMLFLPLDSSIDGGEDEELAQKKRTALIKMTKMPMMWVYASNILLVSTALTFLEPTISPFLEKAPFNLPPYAVGLIYMTIFVAFIIVMGISSYVVKCLGETRIVIVGFSLISIGYFVIAPPNHITGPLSLFAFLHPSGKTEGIIMMVTGFVLIGTGMGLPTNTFIALMAGEAEYNGLGLESSSDAIGALMNSFFSAGGALGPILGGSFVHSFKFPRATCLFGYISVVGVILFAIAAAITKATRSTTNAEIADSGGADQPLLEDP